MGSGLIWVAAACVLFVGTHFAMSHPLRAQLIEKYGERGFSGVYSLVAAVSLALVGAAYVRADDGVALWEVGDILWGIASAVMLFASVLLAGSLIGNPSLPGKVGTPARARGVFVITRHPMMWAFALWAFAHIAVFPTLPNIIVCAAIAFLALVGAAAQDAKKDAHQPEAWRAWRARTSFRPFALVGGGKYRKRDAWPGFVALIGGTLLWLGATWAHIPLAGWAAGIWRWLDPGVVQNMV